MQKDSRPKNLNLLTIKFPIPAIVSILHRISGVILFLFVPFSLWMLNTSLTSEEGFEKLHQVFTKPLSKLILWGILSAFIFHFIAGIRHLLMDIHIGEELKSGRLMAGITLIISILLMIGIGIWLW